MKICIAHEYFYPEIVGGIEQSIKMMIDWLIENKTKIEFIVVTSGKRRSIDYYKGIKIYRYRRFDKKLPYLLRYKINVKRFEKLLLDVCKKENVDIVHSHFLISTESSIAIKNKIGTRVITTVRDHGFYCKEGCPLIGKEICNVCSYMGLLKCTLRKKENIVRIFSNFMSTLIFVNNRERWLNLLENSDLITSTSQFLKNCLIKNGISKDIYVIPNFIDIEEKANFNNKVNTILFVGRLIPEKGINDLLKIVKQIKNKFKQKGWKIIICGDGYLKRKVKSTIKKHSLEGVIEFKGSIEYEKLKNLYKNSKILIFPSKWAEPFGRVIIEAMNYGCMIIGYDSGATSEILGDAGVLVNNGNIDELSSTISHFLDNPKKIEKFSVKATKRAKVFESNKAMKKYLKLYQGV
ncbi:MAG: glycosyltransferase [Candidatus Aenigmarchaeota archaeon]|nr:glycosyltransferase [Candidatus Aenigmarchaeota archaeon]